MFLIFKKYYPVVLPVLSLLFIYAVYAPADKKKPATNPGGFAVVELFTSEGCSSCPPADEAVGRLPSATENIYVLSFHVDYWDYLGWKDPYSNVAYSTRQKQYGAWFRSDAIYTPQVIVNGKEEFVGSNEIKLKEAVSRSLNEVAASGLEIKTPVIHNHAITVRCHSAVHQDEEVNMALVQIRTSGFIQRGENKGKTLNHYFTVRDFKTLPHPFADIDFQLSLPVNLKASDCVLIAFIQNKGTGHIMAAAKKELN